MRASNVMALGAGLFTLVAALAFAQAPATSPQPPKETKPTEGPGGTYTFSGPYTHGNLTIFLIHGADSLPGKQFLTLQEALDQKKVVVHETKQVNELSVENVANDVEVFIQAGDIVKGGQQDRVLAYDLVVPANSGKVPLASFCVEAGRWRKRGAEDASRFQSSTGQVGGKDLKLAVNYARKQDQVWAKVREAQKKLGKNVGKDVANKDSPTSLQLTLEDKQLLEALDKYVKELTRVGEGKKDAIGYALVINGQVQGADVYGSAALFQKLWPKILNSCAVDALAELEKDKKFEPAKVEAVKAFLAEANSGQKTEKDVSKRVHIITQEAPKNLLIETRDQELKGAVIHRCYLAK